MMLDKLKRQLIYWLLAGMFLLPGLTWRALSECAHRESGPVIQSGCGAEHIDLALFHVLDSGSSCECCSGPVIPKPVRRSAMSGNPVNVLPPVVRLEPSFLLFWQPKFLSSGSEPGISRRELAAILRSVVIRS